MASTVMLNRSPDIKPLSLLPPMVGY